MTVNFPKRLIIKHGFSSFRTWRRTERKTTLSIRDEVEESENYINYAKNGFTNFLNMSYDAYRTKSEKIKLRGKAPGTKIKCRVTVTPL